MKESYKHFAAKLKSLRQEKGFSQEQLSRHIKISRPSIGAYEEGRSVPDIEKLIALADYFGTSVDELIRQPKKDISEFNPIN